MRKHLAVLSTAALVTLVSAGKVRAATLPAFPGAEGFAANASGGRPTGPGVYDVYHVTTLADDPTQVVAVVAPTQIAPTENAPTQIAAPEPPAGTDTETDGPERRSPLRAVAVAAVAIVVLVLLLLALPKGNTGAPETQESPSAAQARDLAGWFRDQAE